MKKRGMEPNRLNVQKLEKGWWQAKGDADENENETKAQKTNRTPIRKVDLDMGDKVAFILYNVLTPEECAHLIERTESAGYKQMPEYPPSYRSNTRVIVDDDDLAQEMWRRVQPYMPTALAEGDHTWHPYGLNERWRFCRYTPGQHFSAHFDSAFVSSTTDRSQLTFMFYLNDVNDGGTTVFLEGSKDVVRPVAGMALVFQHKIYHEGERLASGKKYLMRSDVMFHRDDH